MRRMTATVMLAMTTTAVLAEEGATYRARDYGTGYIPLATTTVYAAPAEGAAVVGTLKRLETPLPRLIEAKPGWMHLLMLPAEGSEKLQYDGWIKSPETAEQLDDSLAATMRILTIREKHWPPAVEDDVAKGHVRIGFTKAQAETARKRLSNLLGKPSAKRTVETADGVAEAWAYPDVVLRFKGDKVVEIERLEIK